MKALLLRAPHDFEVVDRQEPMPGPGEAVLRIRYAGICATDVATIEGSSTVAVYPITPGHEMVAVVEHAPTGSRHATGDWVTIYPTRGCGRCDACRRGAPNHCANFSVYGVHRDGGCFAERMLVPDDQLLALPESLHNELGALVEPSAVAVHAIRRACLQGGERVAVIGAGTVGVLVGQAARAAGAKSVVMVDRMPERAALCTEVGLDNFIVSDGSDVAPRLVDQSGGPLDVVFDNASVRSTLLLSIKALKAAGKLILMGFPHDRSDIPSAYADAYRAEVALIFSRNYAKEDFIEAIRLISEGAINARRMITGRFALSDFAAAYSALRDAPANHVKVLIEP